jgi:hypothetical protein
MSRVLPREAFEKEVAARFVSCPFSCHAILMGFTVNFEETLWKRDLIKEGLIKITARGDFEFPEEALGTLKRLTEYKSNEVWLLSVLQVKGILDRVAEKLPKSGIV